MVRLIERFTGVNLNNLTQTQIESVGSTASISPNTRNDLEDLLLIESSLLARQGGNAVIMGLGGVSTLSLVDASPITQTVTANQAWQIQNITVVNTDGVNAAQVTLQLNDGTNGAVFFQESVAGGATTIVKVGNMFAGACIVSPQLQIIADQDGNSTGVTVAISYQVRQV